MNAKTLKNICKEKNKFKRYKGEKSMSNFTYAQYQDTIAKAQKKVAKAEDTLAGLQKKLDDLAKVDTSKAKKQKKGGCK